jgi:hypothetical protein
MKHEQAQPLKFATPAVIQHIQTVIKDTVTPSWLNSVPSNFGDSTAGTLKADEWCTLSTVYLPLALVSIWGAGSTHATPDIVAELQATLDHTMALFSAVHLVCMQTMTKARMLSYRTYIARYIRDLKKIHPRASNKTSHHMVLHIYDFLELFGPVCSWWCFPFERLIGILQRQPKNHKFGELVISLHFAKSESSTGEFETTMLQAFIRGGKL